MEASGFSCLLSRCRSCIIDGTINTDRCRFTSVVNPDPVFSHKDNLCLCAVQALSSQSRPNTLSSHQCLFSSSLITWVNLFLHESRVSLCLSQFYSCFKYAFQFILCRTVCVLYTSGRGLLDFLALLEKTNPPLTRVQTVWICRSVCREERSVLLFSVASRKSCAVLLHLKTTCKKIIFQTRL